MSDLHPDIGGWNYVVECCHVNNSRRGHQKITSVNVSVNVVLTARFASGKLSGLTAPLTVLQRSLAMVICNGCSNRTASLYHWNPMSSAAAPVIIGSSHVAPSEWYVHWLRPSHISTCPRHQAS